MKSARLQALRMLKPFVGKVPVGHLLYMLRKMFNERPHKFGGQIRVNSFFPPYPSEAFDRFCDAIINRKRQPLSTYLAVTHKCPGRCDHCSCHGRSEGDADTASMLKLIDQIAQIGTSTIGFTGGEPLLRDDICELVAAATEKSMNSIIFTTGHGLDMHLAGGLFDAGLGCVTVGVESSEPHEHDAIRAQEGSFDQARAAVGNCNQAGIYTAISTIATHGRIKSGELEKLYAMGEQWGVGEFRILSPVATGKKLGDKTFALSADELKYLKKFHRSHNRRPGGPVIAAFAYFEAPEMFGCGGGYHHLFIDAAGNVCPCDLAPLSFANAFETPLPQIWEEMDKYFHLPRKTCIMKSLGGKVESQSLPIAPEISRELVGKYHTCLGMPKMYQKLFKKP